MVRKLVNDVANIHLSSAIVGEEITGSHNTYLHTLFEHEFLELHKYLFGRPTDSKSIEFFFKSFKLTNTNYTNSVNIFVYRFSNGFFKDFEQSDLIIIFECRLCARGGGRILTDRCGCRNSIDGFSRGSPTKMLDTSE